MKGRRATITSDLAAAAVADDDDNGDDGGDDDGVCSMIVLAT